MISYAQNFEDIMLWRALKNVKNGFYIDIGAYDPTDHSVTRWFYDNEWSGINVEPVKKYYKKFLIERPRDTNIQCLISNINGGVNFYESDTTGLSTSSESTALEWKFKRGFYFKKKKVSSKTLDVLCNENNVQSVHFLKIDVEGFEINVLRGLSFDVIRPWIVVFESVSPIGQHEDVSLECAQYLESKKYHKVYFDGLNTFFVADEHSNLGKVLITPPNVFDEYEIYKYKKLLKENESLLLMAQQDKEAFLLKNNEIALLNQTYQDLQKKYDVIVHSLGWRFIEKIRKIIPKLFPAGSARSIYIHKIVKKVKNII